MKKLDLLVIALAAALSLVPLLFLLQSRDGTRVVITAHGETLYEGALDTDAEITTPDGRNVIRIEGGRVFMARAACPDGACVRQGDATLLRPIVCLPNEVVVALTGEEAALDAITS